MLKQLPEWVEKLSALERKACDLSLKKKYEEAIPLYEKVYEKYTELIQTVKKKSPIIIVNLPI